MEPEPFHLAKDRTFLLCVDTKTPKTPHKPAIVLAIRIRVSRPEPSFLHPGRVAQKTETRKAACFAGK